MRVFNLQISDKPLTNFASAYAQELEIPHFMDVFMRDTLPKQTPHSVECGIVNLNTSSQPGSHWVCYYRNKSDRIHFDSFGQIAPVQVQRYLKIGTEFVRGRKVIQRNTYIGQAVNTRVCDHLCLFVLKSLVDGEQLQTILCNTLGLSIHKVIGKIPFKPNRGFVLLKHRYTGSYNPLHQQLDSKDRPLPGKEPYNVVDAISMRHDICYRDNTNGKADCDRKMLAELNELTPRGGREKMHRQLVRGIIGLEHRLGMGVHWSSRLADELHKPARKHYQKRSVFAKQVDDIWTAVLADMSPYSRSNSGYKYLLTVIDVFSKYACVAPLKTKTGNEVATAFQELFTNNAAPSRLCTDKGREFYNQRVKRVQTADNVALYSTVNELKSSVVERWNKTMKNIMWKYFTANNTQKYIDVLPGMVEKYNST